MALCRLGTNMPIPTTEKTWQHTVNNQAANTTVLNDDNKSVLFTIKQALTGISPTTGRSLNWANPWTVTKSSNGSVANGNDNWNSVADLNWGTGTHSWIVLRQPGTGIEICLDLSNTNTGYMTQVWSPATSFVLTPGTTSTRPTASDEIILQFNTTWLGGQPSAYIARVHAMVSTDGRGSRILVNVTSSVLNSVCLFWLYDQAKNPVTGWTNYNVALSVDDSTANPVTNHSYLANTARIIGVHAGSSMSIYMSSESTWRTGAGVKSVIRSDHIKAPNDFNGEWPITTIGLTSQTAGAVGRHGQLYDIWFGSDFLHGKTYPDNLMNRLAQFHNIILPWNGEGVHLR
jgi:hypothetical protein